MDNILKRKIELLAPGGDLDSIKVAIFAGADAVYCGLDRFNARNRAVNISFDELLGILRLAHKNSCEVFLTLNIVFVDSEFPSLIALLNKLVNTSIDGVIVQDPGLCYLIYTYFPTLKIHASTQFTTHNAGQIKFLQKLHANRVNLARELNIHEIESLAAVAHQCDMLTEVFVHGSYCISFSGICYMSSVYGGNSGNRGRCSQPCRERYVETKAGNEFPLNLKDNSAYFDLPKLSQAGVDSIKIEGRIKKSDYVFTIVNAWRNQLNRFYDNDELLSDNGELYKVFNRDFSDAFLLGDINKSMFIDNPRDHSIAHLSEINHYDSDEQKEADLVRFLDEKENMKALIEKDISSLNIAKIPVKVIVSGSFNQPLHVSFQTPESTFVISSVATLSNVGKEPVNEKMLFQRLKAINETDFYIVEISLESLPEDLYISFKEITLIKKRILDLLPGAKKNIAPIKTPVIPRHKNPETSISLSILISSPSDITLYSDTSADLYFQLPESFSGDEVDFFIDLFRENPQLSPWFPSVFIGADYEAAVRFLKKFKPNKIVTDNTGIAFAACELDIPWIAGPHLNIVNSYSLKVLKAEFHCTGAFLSNEMSKGQIQYIRRPEDFRLHYSIFHPIVLMTSRQCLFQQVTGCEKTTMDHDCLISCKKSETLTNLKNETFIIDKQPGSYHRIYSDTHFLNTDIVDDFSGLFSSFLLDMRRVDTTTTLTIDKKEWVELFIAMLRGKKNNDLIIRSFVGPVTDHQYRKGV